MPRSTFERVPWLALILGYIGLGFAVMFKEGDPDAPFTMAPIFWGVALMIVPAMALLWIREALARYRVSLAMHAMAWFLGVAALVFSASYFGFRLPEAYR